MLCEKIKTLRKSFGISQTELANELNVSKQCVSNWENDYIQPSIELLIKLAKFFKVSTDYLLDLENGNVIVADRLTNTQRAHIALLIKDLESK